MTMTPSGDVLELFLHNVHLGCTPARLRDRTLATALDQHRRPDVIVLNEVPYLFDELAEWCRAHGYAHHQERPGDRRGRIVNEHGSTAVLVHQRRPDLHVIARRVAVMRLEWLVFSKRRGHAPRRFERVVLTTGSTAPGDGVHRWKVTGSHWPTAGNRAAQAETLARTAAWFAAARRRVTLVDVGDKNMSLGALRRWARPLGVRVAGHGVDSAAARRGRVRVRRLGELGSDHEALWVTVHRTGR